MGTVEAILPHYHSTGRTPDAKLFHVYMIPLLSSGIPRLNPPLKGVPLRGTPPTSIHTYSFSPRGTSVLLVGSDDPVLSDGSRQATTLVSFRSLVQDLGHSQQLRAALRLW